MPDKLPYSGIQARIGAPMRGHGVVPATQANVIVPGTITFAKTMNQMRMLSMRLMADARASAVCISWGTRTLWI